MAKKAIRISLATKFRLLYGLAILGVIAVALVLPWYFTELLAEQVAQARGDVLTAMRLEEWRRDHVTTSPASAGPDSYLVRLSGQAFPREEIQGPIFRRVGPLSAQDAALSSSARKAIRAFQRDSQKNVTVERDEDARGRRVFRFFRAVRFEPSCELCHQEQRLAAHFQPRELVGLIEASGSGGDRPMIWLTRVAFGVGGGLAGLLAFVLFGIITYRLILKPVRQLRHVADKVAEGDLAVRSPLRTHDELQHLGDSFNEMLAAIADQHGKLLSANRALDLRLNELAEANVALFQANKVKSEFLANVSHELRTPLNSILGFADLLTESGDERIARYGGNISSAAKNLLNLINDLLDLARIEAGKASVRFDKVSVTDTCQTLAALMKPLADKKQIDLQAQLGADVPLVVTDGGKVQQILYNLLSNAIKFTPAGGQVVVAARLEPAAPGGKEEVAISVSDTGPGIPESEQQRVFEKFYRPDSTLTQEVSGAGLGLSIVKELTNLLGGRLNLKSSPGHGAVFTLLLPLEPPKPPNARPA